MTGWFLLYFVDGKLGIKNLDNWQKDDTVPGGKVRNQRQAIPVRVMTNVWHLKAFVAEFSSIQLR